MSASTCRTLHANWVPQSRPRIPFAYFSLGRTSSKVVSGTVAAAASVEVRPLVTMSASGRRRSGKVHRKGSSELFSRFQKPFRTSAASRADNIWILTRLNEGSHARQGQYLGVELLALLGQSTSESCRKTGHRMRKLRNGFLACLLLSIPTLAMAARNTWIASWATSPEWADPDPNLPLLNIERQTVRERVRLSIGGTRIIIRLSNEYGTTPLQIESTTVAAPIDPADVESGSIHTVTFSRREAVTIPAGAAVFSDPVAFPVKSGREISISLYFPNRVAAPTLHELALKRAVVSHQGDFTRADRIEAETTQNASISLTAVLVPSRRSQRLVVTFGDSITDGDGSTVDADRNWQSDLIRRLGMTPEGSKVAVVNAGIAGNRLLSDGFGAGAGFGAGFGLSALARFDRDALAMPGVTHIVLLEGINDIGFPGAKLGERYLADPTEIRTLEALFNAYRQLISRAHVLGIKIIGATISPFEGTDLPGYYSDSKEATRRALNQWIRSSGSFDGVIDFDAVLRDPNHPSRLLAGFASIDRLHPNDAGYQAMADAIDLSLFR